MQPSRIEQTDPIKRYIAPEGMRWLEDTKHQCVCSIIAILLVGVLVLGIHVCQS